MKKEQTLNSKNRASWLFKTIVVGVLILGLPSTVRAASFDFGASFPVVVPLGYSTTIGTGVLPSIQLGLTEHLNMGLNSGIIYYTDTKDDTDFEIPLMLETKYIFMDQASSARPYLLLGVGYSYAHGSNYSNNWLSTMGGVGLCFQASRDIQIDVGLAVRIPTVRDISEYKPRLSLNLGFLYSLL